MRESELLSAFLKLARREEPEAVIFKHSDPFTSGIPDVSWTKNGKTAWLEFKLATRMRIKWQNELQRRTCLRLERVGICRVIAYDAGIEETYIVQPEQIDINGRFTTYVMKAGIDHRFVLEFVRGLVKAR